LFNLWKRSSSAEAEANLFLLVEGALLNKILFVLF
jgi:hypothetical protein